MTQQPTENIPLSIKASKKNNNNKGSRKDEKKF